MVERTRVETDKCGLNSGLRKIRRVTIRLELTGESLDELQELIKALLQRKQTVLDRPDLVTPDTQITIPKVT